MLAQSIVVPTAEEVILHMRMAEEAQAYIGGYMKAIDIAHRNARRTVFLRDQSLGEDCRYLESFFVWEPSKRDSVERVFVPKQNRVGVMYLYETYSPGLFNLKIRSDRRAPMLLVEPSKFETPIASVEITSIMAAKVRRVPRARSRWFPKGFDQTVFENFSNRLLSGHAQSIVANVTAGEYLPTIADALLWMRRNASRLEDLVPVREIIAVLWHAARFWARGEAPDQLPFLEYAVMAFIVSPFTGKCRSCSFIEVEKIAGIMEFPYEFHDDGGSGYALMALDNQFARRYYYACGQRIWERAPVLSIGSHYAFCAGNIGVRTPFSDRMQPFNALPKDKHTLRVWALLRGAVQAMWSALRDGLGLVRLDASWVGDYEALELCRSLKYTQERNFGACAFFWIKTGYPTIAILEGLQKGYLDVDTMVTVMRTRYPTHICETEILADY